ncbi:AAA family ATPase [Rhodothermus profundi]|uniref:EVE domain-containing protein n=1 Tax=Rhodothermus profundi TaxID=633813 RepID=A0A1M6W1Y3_9BACT|nr:AAA family ATPase [Rhodothermus profundi]SHK87628.1 EVE domain-containing protein [Rhodothermus profundi]
MAEAVATYRVRNGHAWLWAIPPQHYPAFLQTSTFAVHRVGRAALHRLRPGDRIFAYLSGSKVLVGLFEVTGEPFEDHTPLVPGVAYPHRVRVRPLVVLSEEAWIPFEAFADKLEVVRHYADFRSVVQQVLHPLPRVDEKVLEFLIRARAADLERAMSALEELRRLQAERLTPGVREKRVRYQATPFDRAAALETLFAYLEQRGFIYAPWIVAAYVTALRTKPLVILAGPTGTGKSKLPVLVAEATGGIARLIPVRPDWADSTELLGYVDLQGRFRPGPLLRLMREAQQQRERFFVGVLDELNLARPEQYLAEALSRIEDRQPLPEGGWTTAPLLQLSLAPADQGWARVAWPANVALVGTVNVDETTHGFSRKVIDRAFTLELTEIDLKAIPSSDASAEPTLWPVTAWLPRALRLAELPTVSDAEQKLLQRVLETLQTLNRWLRPAGFPIAYRTRDEVALFVLHAAETPEMFRTRTGQPVDPLDLALWMKVLPRLQGSSPALRRALRALLGWAATGVPTTRDEELRTLLETWITADYPDRWPEAPFPMTAARLAHMWLRLESEGFASFWE